MGESTWHNTHGLVPVLYTGTAVGVPVFNNVLNTGIQGTDLNNAVRASKHVGTPSKLVRSRLLGGVGSNTAPCRLCHDTKTHED